MRLSLAQPRPLRLILALALAATTLTGTGSARAAGDRFDPAGELSAQTPPPPPPPSGPGGGGTQPQPPAPPATPSGQQQPPPPPQASFSGSSAITLTVDTPTNDERITSKSLRIKGWAVDPSAGQGTGIDQVEVYIDGPRGQGSLLGQASYGIARQDVANALGGGDRYLFSGFELIWTEVIQAAPGYHTITVAAHSPANGWAERTIPIIVVGKLEVTASAVLAGPPIGGYPYAPGSPLTGAGAVYPPLPLGGSQLLVPVTFTAIVTRNGAPVAGAQVTVAGTAQMPPTDSNGYTQMTIVLPVESGGLVGAHITATHGGQVADTDAYIRYNLFY